MVGEAKIAVPPTMHFELRSVPDWQRMEVLHDVAGRVLANSDLNPLDNRPDFELSIWALPEVIISRASCSPHRCVSGLDPRRRENDLIFTWCSSPAPSFMRQHGKEKRTDFGHAALITSAEPLLAHNIAEISINAVKIERQVLRAFVGDPYLELMRGVACDTPAFTILKNYLDYVVQAVPQEDAALRSEIATHICELIALSLTDSARRIGIEALPARLVFPAVKRWIQRRMLSPTLTIGKVSVAFGISERTLQLLFRAQGTTFTNHLRELRLAYAHDRLVSSDKQSISSIALESGFSDLSYFNRSFRERYGLTPSDQRRNRELDC